MTTLSRACRAVGFTLVALSTALVSGCQAGDDQSPRPEEQGAAAARASDAVADADPSQEVAAEVKWSSRVDAIGQPVRAGSALLVLARAAGGRLELVSLDRTTGRRNFAMPFHPGSTPTGVGLEPRVTRTSAGRWLAVLRRVAPGSSGSGLVVVDVRTGAVVRSTPFAVDDYDACSDGTDVCWSGYDGGFNEVGIAIGGGPTRWDLETGRVVENDGQQAARQVGSPDLYVRGEGRLATISRLPGTRTTMWNQPVSVAVSPGADPSYGWSFRHDKKTDVYVGSLGRPFPAALVKRFERGQRVTFTYESRYYTVGIDGRTGEQLWRRRGADAYCPLIPGAPNVETRVLCVVGGTAINQKGKDARDKGLAVEVQGIEPRSGKVTWRYTLDTRAVKQAYTNDRAPLAPFGVVFPSGDGAIALDMRTGARQRVADGAVLLCSTGSGEVTAYGMERSAGTLYRACRPDGRAARGVPSVFGVSGVEASRRTSFVSMPGRVVAYELR